MASEAVRPLVYLTTKLTPLRLISPMLENWLSKFDDNERRVMLVGQPHYIGLFENVVMILFLTISSILHLCRLFSGVLMVATVDAPTA